MPFANSSQTGHSIDVFPWVTSRSPGRSQAPRRRAAVLRAYVEALGGRLKVTVFDDSTYLVA